MKAIGIIGSPRNDGSTAVIVDKIIDGMNANGIESIKYCLGDMDINYCLGCKCCDEHGECIQVDDDMSILMDGIISSDIVIIASPSYWGDVTGQLKVFFDRSTPYCNMSDNGTQIPSGKKGIAVSIRAGRTIGENLHIIESIEHYFGHLGIETVGRFMAEGIDKKDDLLGKPELLEKAYELGLSIINS